MIDLEAHHALGRELEARLRLRTFPLAVKLIVDEGEIPADALRPTRDLGGHISLCQAFQLSRRGGKTVAMVREDHWCCEPVIGYGLGEAPAWFVEGHNRYPGDVATLEAGRRYAEELPKLPPGRCVGTLCAPLTDCSFEPDVVMIYCDPAQLSLLLLAREHLEGGNLRTSLSAHAACVYGVVPALAEGECQVAIPCGGDRTKAMAADNEVIFSIPAGRMDELMTGLRNIEKAGRKLPVGYSFLPEYPLPPAYQRIAEEMGYLDEGGADERPGPRSGRD
jgi:uncharacterized protein (DUF169 family)